jgi:flagellar hook-length control protein FliK
VPGVGKEAVTNLRQSAGKIPENHMLVMPNVTVLPAPPASFASCGVSDWGQGFAQVLAADCAEAPQVQDASAAITAMPEAEQQPVDVAQTVASADMMLIPVAVGVAPLPAGPRKMPDSDGLSVEPAPATAVQAATSVPDDTRLAQPDAGAEVIGASTLSDQTLTPGPDAGHVQLPVPSRTTTDPVRPDSHAQSSDHPSAPDEPDEVALTAGPPQGDIDIPVVAPPDTGVMRQRRTLAGPGSDPQPAHAVSVSPSTHSMPPRDAQIVSNGAYDTPVTDPGPDADATGADRHLRQGFDEKPGLAVNGAGAAAVVVSQMAERPVGAVPTVPAATVQHIVAQVDLMARRTETGTVEIALSPKELGHVRLTLSETVSGLNVTIQTERPETADLMRRHLGELTADLRDLGYRGLSFAFGGDPGRHGAPAGGVWTRDGPPSPGPTLRDIPVAPNRRGTDGALDLRL